MKKCRHRLPHMLNNFLSTTQPQPDPLDQGNIEPIAHPTPDPPNDQPAPPAPDPLDDHPTALPDQPAPPTPGPLDDQHEALPEQVATDSSVVLDYPTVVTDEQPLPQRRSNRRKKLVNYQI